MCDECASLPRSELDDLAQTLYGVIAALDALLRGAPAPDQALPWAIRQLSDAQQRLTQASRG